MGIFESISKAVLTPIAAVGNLIGKGLKSTGIVKSYTPQKAGDLAKTTFGKVLGTSIAATGVALAGAAAAGSSAGAVSLRSFAGKGSKIIVKGVKSVVPSTAKGKVIAAVTAPIAVGAVVKQPKAAAEAVIKAPKELAQFGGNVADVAVNPSKESVSNLIKESPVLTAAAGAAGLAAVGGSVAGLVSGALTRGEIKKQTEALTTLAEKQVLTTTQPTIAPQQAITPATQAVKEAAPLSTTSTPRKRRSRSRSKPISQRVNVIVNQKNTGVRITKKYLNKVYAR